jgi:hypothetical protein
VKLIAASPDLLDPVLDGLVVGKLMDDHAVGVRRLALVDSKLLAVAEGDSPAAVTLHRFHDLGYDLAVVGLGVIDFGVDDHEPSRRRRDYLYVGPARKVVNMDIRANEIRTQPDDEQRAMLVRALALVVGRAENPAEITA